MADEIRLSDNIEAEFNPLVVIVADEPEKYASFSQHLVKNGFKCEVFGEIPDALVEMPTPGAVFFVSFNLKTSEAGLLARRIEQKNNVCIVFAEQQGFDTAAKLSSAKMTQTLQHPYTEKNFLMAVQTIVKKRKVQHDKDLRKQSVLDRRKGMTEAASAADDEGDRVFKSDAAPSTRTPLIFEERRRGKKFFSIIEGSNAVQGHPRFMHDRRRRGLMAIQKGLVAAKFTLLQSAPSSGAMRAVAGGPAGSSAAAVQKGSRADSEIESKGSLKAVSGAIVQEGTGTKAKSVVSNRPLAKDGIVYMPGVAKVTELTHAIQERSAAVGEALAKVVEKVRNVATSTEEESDAKAQKKREGEVLVGYEKEDLKKDGPPILVLGPVTEPSVADEPGEKNERESISPMSEVTKIAGPIAVPTWALIAAFSIGILFVLFFLYQMIFDRHH